MPHGQHPQPQHPEAGRGRGRGLGGFGSWQLGRGGLGARGLGGARGVGRGMFGGWAGGAQALTPGVLVLLGSCCFGSLFGENKG